MLVKFSTLLGGLFIEEKYSEERRGDERCFRFDDKGNAEYCILRDATLNGERARFFHHSFKEKDFTFA